MAESEWEGGQQADDAQHQPGLVAVPDRRDRVHDEVARRGVRREAEEDADPEIEAVQHHVEEDTEAEDDGPERDEIDHDDFSCPPSPSGECIDRPARPAALHRFAFLVGRAALHQLGHHQAARRVHDEIDDHIAGQGQRDIRGAERGRHRIRGAQQAVDGPGLSPDLGRGPAGEHGDEADRRRVLADPQIPIGDVEIAAEAQPPAQRHDRQHENAKPDHDAEGEERHDHRRAVLLGKILETLDRGIGVMGQNEAAEDRDRNLQMIGLGPPGRGSQTE